MTSTCTTAASRIVTTVLTAAGLYLTIRTTPPHPADFILSVAVLLAGAIPLMVAGVRAHIASALAEQRQHLARVAAHERRTLLRQHADDLMDQRAQLLTRLEHDRERIQAEEFIAAWHILHNGEAEADTAALPRVRRLPRRLTSPNSGAACQTQVVDSAVRLTL